MDYFKKIILLWLISFFMSGYAHSLTQTPDKSILLPICYDKDICGYINEQGKNIITPQFSEAYRFNNDMAIVREHNLYGVIDRLGNYLIKPTLQNIGDFSNGLAAAKKDNLYGYIDISGEFVIKPQFTRADKFSKQVAPVLVDKKWGVINKKGEFIVKPQFQYIGIFYEGLARVVKNEKFGLINTEGHFIIKPEFQHIAEFNEGLAPAKKDNLYGYINHIGEFSILPQFQAAKFFSEGLAAVKKDNLYGFINKKGDFIINPQYQYTEYFIDGLAYTTQNKKVGFINKQGKWQIKPIFTSDMFLNEEYFSNGFIKIAPKYSDEYYINNTGSSIYPSKKILISSDNRLTQAAKPQKLINFCYIEKKCGYIDMLGKIVIPPIYEEAQFFNYGLAQVKKDGLYGLINHDGKFILKPHFQSLAFGSSYGNPFSNDFIIIQQDNKFGLVDHFGHVIIAPTHDKLEFTRHKNLLLQYSNGLKGLINLTGEPIIDPNFYNIDTNYDDFIYYRRGYGSDQLLGFSNITAKKIFELQVDELRAFKEGLSAIRKDKKYGFINTQGEIIVQPKYDYVSDFNDGLCYVSINNLYGFINTNGSIVIEPQFKNIDRLKNSFYRVKKDGLYGLANNKGEIITTPQFDEIRQFKDGFARIIKNNLYGLINEKGEIIIPPQFEYLRLYDSSLVIIKNNGLYGLIKIDDYTNNQSLLNGMIEDTTQYILHPLSNHNINVIIPPQFNAIGDKEDSSGESSNDDISFYDGITAKKFIKITKNGLMGLASLDGKIQISPQYQQIESYSPDKKYPTLLLVKKDGLLGVIDINENVIIKPQFEDMDSYPSSMIKIKKNGLYGFIGIYSKNLVKPQFEDVYTYNNHIAWVKKNGLFGLFSLNKKKWVIPAQFNQVFQWLSPDFSNKDFLQLYVQKGHLSGLIYFNGTWILKPQFELIAQLDNSILMVKHKGRLRLISTKGHYLTTFDADIAKFSKKIILKKK